MSNKKPFYELEGMAALAQVTKINEGQFILKQCIGII